MPDSLTPSEWFNDHFGDHSLAVMKELVAAGQAAHIRSLEAKAGSKLRTNDAYGASFWLVLPEEIVTHLTFLPGVEILKPRRGRYELIVFENAMLFPSRIGGDSAAPDSIKLRTSKVRHEMFSLESRTSPDEPLSFESLDYEDETVGPRYVADFGSATSLIFAAYDCSARGGLQHGVLHRRLERAGLHQMRRAGDVDRREGCGDILDVDLHAPLRVQEQHLRKNPGDGAGGGGNVELGFGKPECHPVVDHRPHVVQHEAIADPADRLLEMRHGIDAVEERGRVRPADRQFAER